MEIKSKKVKGKSRKLKMNGEKPPELNEECLTMINSLHFLLLPFYFLL